METFSWNLGEILSKNIHVPRPYNKLNHQSDKEDGHMFCDNNIHHGCCHRPFTINIIYLLTVYITDTVKFRTRISVLLLRYKWKFSDFVNINYFECNKTYSHLNKSVMTGEIVLLVTEKIICFLSRVYFNFPPPFLFSDFFDTNS